MSRTHGKRFVAYAASLFVWVATFAYLLPAAAANAASPVEYVAATPATATPFVDASTAVLGLAAHNAIARVDFPFTVTLYGAPYTFAQVSTNGNIQFSGTTSTAADNTLLPGASLGAAIVPYWDDLTLELGTAPPGAHGVFTASVAATPTSPERFVSEWRGHEVAPSTDPVDFEVIFTKGATTIQTLYKEGDAASATIGVQSSGTGPFTQFSFNDSTKLAAAHGEVDYVVAPQTTITSHPADPTKATSATFAFEADQAGSTFQCRIDGGAYATCTSPKAYAGLTEGAHTFLVKANNGVVTEPSPAAFTWMVDVTPPQTTITSGPADPTNATSASFAFASTEAGSTFQCRIDGGAYASCTSPKAYTGLSEGAHTFKVYATDPAGNVDPTPATDTWTIDLTPPDTTITSGPAATVAEDSATFKFVSTEAGSTFQCSLDGGAYASCASPKTYTNLVNGLHTFRVKAVDPAGNVDPSADTWSWTVAAGVPDTTITSGPTNPTNATSATFAFTSTEAGSTFQCSLDGAAYASCTSPTAYTGLAEGAHTFKVYATDSAGNVDPTPASYAWTVDLTVPPAVTGLTVHLVRGVQVATTGTVPVGVAWTGSTGAVLYQIEASLSGGPFASVMQTAAAAATVGTPFFQTQQVRVRAVDAAGNVSAWQTTSPFVVRGMSDEKARYGSAWREVARDTAWGGHLYTTTKARATMTYRFTGRAIGWVGSVGPSFGRARVYVDGTYIKTVSAQATSFGPRMVLFMRQFATSGTHVLKIVNLGTLGHPRMNCDGFLVLR